MKALIVDWGGVLTSSLGPTFEQWARDDGIDYPHYLDVMSELLGPKAVREAQFNPIHALERGEMEVRDFEVELASRLRTSHGRPVQADGLLQRMFDRFEHAPDMSGLVRRAHSYGLRTALLSNSWGNTYPRDGWSEIFDQVVISGEVGMRKPEAEIYRYTCSLLGVEPEGCVFVDDLPINVRGAVEIGMVGVVHSSYEQTKEELEAIFGVSLD